MATTYNLSINKNPNFNTVLGLTNTVFDRNNVRSGRMATEDQIQQLWQDIIRLEERIDYCCREIVYWDFQVRIRDKNGNVVSDYLENRTTGITRRGKNFTMKLPIKAVPKYELNIAGNTTASNYENDNNLACVKNETAYTFINDLCSLIYRGTEGQYFNMSARQTTPGLGFSSIGPGGTSPNDSTFAAFAVNDSGGVGTGNLFRAGGSTSSSNYPYFTPYSHYAYVEGDDIYVNVFAPVGDLEWFGGNLSTNRVRPYGRLYKMDVRDVTLGG